MVQRTSPSALPFMIAHEMTRRFIQPKKGEQVLILADGESDMDFVQAFAAAAYVFEAEPTIMVMPPTFLEGAERALPSLILKALEAADIYLPMAATTFAALHDIEIGKALYDKTRPKNCRKFTPGSRHGAGLYGSGLQLTLDALRNHDYEKVHEWCLKFCKYLNKGKEIRVTSQAGTDLTAALEEVGSTYRPYGAFARNPGETGAIPAGETGGGPKEFTAEGVIAIDGPIASIAEKPVLSQPVMVTVKAGRVTRIEGGEEAEALRQIVANNENADVLAEIALGTNPYLQHTGQINVTDKRILGTIHVAFGENKHQIYPYGTAWSPVHVDALLLKPSCWVDGVQLLKDGTPTV